MCVKNKKRTWYYTALLNDVVEDTCNGFGSSYFYFWYNGFCNAEYDNVGLGNYEYDSSEYDNAEWDNSEYGNSECDNAE